MIRSVLAFLKPHLFNIMCALVAVASIALGVVGIVKMSDVSKQMGTVKSLYGQFDAAARNPVNLAMITARKTEVDTIKSHYQGLLQEAYALNRYEPLPGPGGEALFPNPSRDGRLSFPDIYKAQFGNLIERLQGGTPPSAEEVQQMRDEIEEERRAAITFNVDEGPALEPTRPTQAPSEPEHPSGLITEQAARESAETRAAIRKARQLRMYVDRSAFDEVTRLYSVISPDVRDMWRAQLTLWIQQDVVEALAAINDRQARVLEEEGERAWVGVLPIKELISIRVSDYLPTEATRGEASPFGSEPAPPIVDAELAFTKSTSTELYDLVHFAVKLVVDARDLPTVINELSKNSFHTLLDVSYAYERAELENLKMQGKIYGSEPTVKVVLQFETVFFGDIYRRLMPDPVLAALGRERPKNDDGDS